MTNDEFTQMMQISAEDAINIAADEHKITLDYSISSLIQIDKLIEAIKLQTLSDDETFTYSYVLGAYLGEVFIRNFGGDWLFIQETDDEPPQTFVKKDGCTIAFPSKVYHALMGNEEQSLAEYFCDLAQQQPD